MLLFQAERCCLVKSSDKYKGGKNFAPASTVWDLDQDRINADAQINGYYGIQTRGMDLPAQDVIEAYHTLGKIEENFRMMKSTLEVRPIFHWTPKPPPVRLPYIFDSILVRISIIIDNP